MPGESQESECKVRLGKEETATKYILLLPWVLDTEAGAPQAERGSRARLSEQHQPFWQAVFL